MGWAILNAAGLSFIGLGVRPPTPEWGIMVAEGANFIVSGEWWLALFPGLALMLAVFCFNLLGDGLRDIVDPAAADMRPTMPSTANRSLDVRDLTVEFADARRHRHGRDATSTSPSPRARRSASSASPAPASRSPPMP